MLERIPGSNPLQIAYMVWTLLDEAGFDDWVMEMRRRDTRTDKEVRDELKQQATNPPGKMPI